jgi:hypothetical protein
MYGDMVVEIEIGNFERLSRLSVSDSVRWASGVGIWLEKELGDPCEAASVPNTLFHDLRRTASTNMIEAAFRRKKGYGDKRPTGQGTCLTATI